MAVVMKGGTSGCEHDYLPNVSVAYDKQVPQNTASNSCPQSGVTWGTQPSGNREGDVSPPVPCNGSPDDSAL